MVSQMATVQISDDSYKTLERIVRQSLQFDTVDDLVNYILSTTVASAEQNREVPQALQDRLKDLGYL